MDRGSNQQNYPVRSSLDCDWALGTRHRCAGLAMVAAIIIITVLALFLAIVSPGFRNVLLVAAAIGGLAIWYFYDKETRATEERRKREAAWRAWSETAITLNELTFSGVHLKSRSYGPYMALEGAVANNAKYTLDQLQVQVILKDCEDKRKELNCKIVGQATAWARPSAPSGQKWSFVTEDLRFENLPKDVQVTCTTTNPCNAGRVFNWSVLKINAAL